MILTWLSHLISLIIFMKQKFKQYLKLPVRINYNKHIILNF